MFNNKPIINSSPTGFATDIGNNHLGSFDTQGNFKTLLDPYPTAKVDAFGYLRDNVTNNVIGEVRGVLPRNDLYTHKPYNCRDTFESPLTNTNKLYDF